MILAVLTVGGPVAHKPKPRYGATASITTPLPSGYQLATSALQDADKWWQSQGSTPPPLQLQITKPVGGETMGYGFYNTGQVDIAPEYLSNVTRAVRQAQTRQGKIAALVGMWRLMAHERGHNLGYQHIPGGIMDATWASPPGEAYAWARSILSQNRGPRAK